MVYIHWKVFRQEKCRTRGCYNGNVIELITDENDNSNDNYRYYY